MLYMVQQAIEDVKYIAMKIYEITERVNPESVKPDFKVRYDINDRFFLTGEGKEDGTGLIVYAYDKERGSESFNNIGMARFIIHNKKAPPEEQHMEVSMTYVAPEYKRMGIASAMYNLARKYGNDIMPSASQSKDAQAFWAAGAGLGKDAKLPNLTPKSEPKIEPLKKKTWLDKVKGAFA